MARSYNEYYRVPDTDIESFVRTLVINEIGILVVMVVTILGVFLLGSGLMEARGEHNAQHSSKGVKKIIIGAILTVFSTIVGIIIVTVRNASSN